MLRVIPFFSALFLVSVSLPPCGWAGTLAQFRTRLGDMEVELFDQDKPLTTENFIRYVKTGGMRIRLFIGGNQASLFKDQRDRFSS